MAENSNNNIRILSEHLSNQIAAGEVVQRPESVVKELAENAIDAGATSITVVVKEAGKQLIQVLDNGSGISKLDLPLSIVRHATSKIYSDADLYGIETLGFRGEALASVAAIADVEIRSRVAADDNGWVLYSKPGGRAEISPAALDVGTQILVRNLFYNTPARRKFLKSDLTEFRHISETMQKVALGNPDVRFVFYDGSNLVFDVPIAPLQKRIADILAIDPKRQMVEVSLSDNGIKVEGLVGLPSSSRQSRSGQFLFLNKRSIVSRAIGHAISSSYEHLLDKGQHPVFVINLTLDPRKVDVNVHPQKHEVKFEDERSIYLLVQHAVTTALRSAKVIPSFLGDVNLSRQPLQSLGNTPQSGSTFVNRITGEVHTSYPSSQPDYVQQSALQRAGWSKASQEGFEELFNQSESGAAAEVIKLGTEYIVTTAAEGLVVIHRARACERVIYSKAATRHAESSSAEQAVLFSTKFTLAPSRATLLKQFAQEFSALGFRMEIENSGSVTVFAVPVDVKPGTEETIVDDVLQDLENGGLKLPIEKRIDRICSAYAARVAQRVSTAMSDFELRSLATTLFQCSVAHVSPRGEPTYVIVPFKELGEKFV